jgi:hypothetical protein
VAEGIVIAVRPRSAAVAGRTLLEGPLDFQQFGRSKPESGPAETPGRFFLRHSEKSVAWYNFARKHETLKGNTPAMASESSDHVWTIKEWIEKAGEA